MSMLAGVTKGKVKKPYAIVVYGPDGVGKSTFGAGAPSPIFLGPEQGTNHLDVSRFPTPKKWADVLQAVKELQVGKHDFKTLVIDSLDWLEPLVHQSICKAYGAKSIELAAGGYGKGYGEALDEFIHLKDELNVLRDVCGMHIILIAHAQVVTFNDPENQITYDRFELKLHKKSCAMFREYADAVMLASYQIYTAKDPTNDKKIKTYGDGARVMYTERRPGFDAKNRLGLPFTLGMSPVASESWAAFEKAADVGEPEMASAIIERIEAMYDLVPKHLIDKVKDSVAKSATAVPMLMAIENRVSALVKTTPVKGS